jgi:hypothetical protein
MCANHPWSPGVLTYVSGIACVNYQPRPPEPKGDIRRIPLGDGRYAIVDAADYEWLRRWTWHVEDGYAVRCEKGKRIYMHRQIAEPPDGLSVDHANRVRADNRRANVRICTHQENMYNRAKRAGSASRFKGVGFRKRDKKWYAELGSADKPLWLGFFDSEIEAARAYDAKAVEHFGEFAWLNFPQEWPPERRQEVHARRQQAATEEGRKVGEKEAKRGTGNGKKARGRKVGR